MNRKLYLARSTRIAARKLGEAFGERHRVDRADRDGMTLALESALSEHGFEPWHDDAGVVRMRNCPFRRLAEPQPGVVCYMNLALVQGLIIGLGADNLRPVLARDREGCCVDIPAVSQDTDGAT